VKVFLDCLQDGVRVQLDVPHDLRERVPFDLSERKEHVLVGQHGMLAPPCFLNRAIDDSLGAFANLAW
jgi:hypothetical protein